MKKTIMIFLLLTTAIAGYGQTFKLNNVPPKEYGKYTTLTNSSEIVIGSDTIKAGGISAQCVYIMNQAQTERPYKVYVALLTQNGTNAPQAEVVENTLGFTPVFVYNGVGQYFSDNREWEDLWEKKVLCFGCITPFGLANMGYDYGDNTIYLRSRDYNGVLSNNIISDSDGYRKTSIEIRVYD